MLYRILTENKNRKYIAKIVSDEFEGFTIYKSQGFWRGVSERSLTIEIYAKTVGIEDRVKSVCRLIKEYNKQECVLVQKLEVEAEFI